MSTNNTVEKERVVLPQQLKMMFKCILLLVTAMTTFLYIGGIDSIYDNGYLIEYTLIVVALIYTCYKAINEQEVDILLGNKLLEKWFDKYKKQ